MITAVDSESRHSMEVSTLKNGDFFGEMALLHENNVRAANVIATSKVVCLAMSKANFTSMLGSLEEIKTTSVKRHSEIKKISSIKINLESKEVVKTPKATKEVMKTGKFWRSDIKLTDLSDVVVLGFGAFGKVKLVKTSSGELFAMKCLRMSKIMQMGQKEHVSNEKNILAQCEHPFVLKMYNFFKDKYSIYLLLE
eukprot:Sdes_comp16343_c0_seq3m5701